ncbi:sodium/solute symporter [Verrucomicrobiaceae bacterium N1E253]|uniref:Sodium/solute symporter n=1 Tax=Oceaniferula marina TaxID=2748318 RepID=A0A851GKR1_9BACT|nr:sodium/solute symporter [Oceaniferula marina]NWK54754.1 sodium/solute symporter [Oceaniferula marina]
MKRLRFISLFLTALCSWALTFAGEAIEWNDDFPRLPDAHGFAGPFAGVVGEKDNRWLVVGGGANFPDGAPWTVDAEGYKPPKIWHDSLFAIQLEADSLKAKGAWKKLDLTLPEKLGYGSSVTLPARKTALFIGGNRSTDAGMYHSPKVFEVSQTNAGIAINEVASLPDGISAAGTAIIGNTVFVFSGASEKGSLASCWALDTSAKDNSTWTWQAMPWPESAPGIPARPREHCITGVQDGKWYVFAGRTAIDESIETDASDRNRMHGVDFLRDAYVYSPPAKGAIHTGSWKRVADLPHGLSAAPQSAVPAGVSHLLVLGGVDVPFLRQQKKDRPELNGQGEAHPGFPSSILAYHTITNTWIPSGNVPQGPESERRANDREVSYAPVTTPVVIVGKEFLVPTGEIKPGIRSNQVLSGIVKGKKLGFGIINWIVVVVYLLGMVGIGYWFMKHEAASSTDAYFRGGQRIPWWVAGLSIFATMLSAITFMAIPGTAYATNWNGYIGQWPILVIVPLVVFCYLPFYRRLNITTAYEYLEKRFNVASRVIASITFMLFHVGRVAIVLYLPALALSSVTSINIYAAIFIIGILCVIYTVMGGIEAVVWTDAIQAMVLIGGALLCFGLVVFQVDGGIGAVGAAMTEQSKGITKSFDLTNLSISKSSTSGIIFFLAFMFANLPSYTAGQDVVQRYVTTPTEKEAARSLWLNIVMVLCGSAIFFALGTALFVFYQAHPEKLDPAMPAKDGILPFFIMQNLPVGVAGIIIAGVFAAAQSTISSSLNSVATAFVTDVYGRLIKPESDDGQRLKVARNVVIILGSVGIVVSSYIAWTKIDSAFMLFNTFIGFALGPLGGLFALGVFTKHSSGKAGLIGLLCGVVTVVTVHILNETKIIDVMPLLYGFIGFTSTFIAGALLGCFMPAKAEEVNGLTLLTQKK